MDGNAKLLLKTVYLFKCASVYHQQGGHSDLFVLQIPDCKFQLRKTMQQGKTQTSQVPTWRSFQVQLPSEQLGAKLDKDIWLEEFLWKWGEKFLLSLLAMLTPKPFNVTIDTYPGC